MRKQIDHYIDGEGPTTLTVGWKEIAPEDKIAGMVWETDRAGLELETSFSERVATCKITGGANLNQYFLLGVGLTEAGVELIVEYWVNAGLANIVKPVDQPLMAEEVEISHG